MPQLLGIDYGLERTGLALACDQVVLPLTTLRLGACGSRKKLLDAIAAIAVAKNAEAIVMGLPQGANGEESLTCVQIRHAAERLKHRVTIPIHFMTEILSSFEAAAILRARDLKGKKLHNALDQMAACQILTSWLHLSRQALLPQRSVRDSA